MDKKNRIQLDLPFEVVPMHRSKWFSWLETRAKGRIGVAMIFKVFSSAQIVESSTKKVITQPGSSWAINNL